MSPPNATVSTRMKEHMLHRILTIAGGVLAASVLTLLTSASAAAQNGSVANQFVFGPPLRTGIVFHYKYTERVKTWLLDKKGSVQDTSERILTYYVSERQTEAEIGGGATLIEANIDSMRLDYRGVGGDVMFNTQNKAEAQDMQRLRHPAVLVPSTLVSSVARFTISPYGSLVGMQSKAFESILEQAQDPMLDDFTYKRIEQMINEEYLSTVFLPWRNIVPYGHTLEFGKEMRVPFVDALDRVVFVDSVSVLLQPGDVDPLKPTLSFKATLSGPKTEWATFEGRVNPVLLKGANAIVTGQYNLDRDGVVLSGFSVANGTITGSARGQEMSARVEHQTYVELIDMKASPVN